MLCSNGIPTYVRGDTLRALRFIVKDAGVVVDITGWSVKFQAESADLPGVNLDLAGVVTNGPLGKCEVQEFGNSVTALQLGSKRSARFVGRLRVVNPATKIGYAEEATVDIVATPIP